MIRICADCKKKMGEKPPYEDKRLTHGLCPKCLAIKLAQLNAWRKEIKEDDDE